MDVQVYKRLQEIDAYGAEARAATILAGLSFDNSMQVLPFRGSYCWAGAAKHMLLDSQCLSPVRSISLSVDWISLSVGWLTGWVGGWVDGWVGG